MNTNANVIYYPKDKRSFRSRTASTKLTDEEFAEIECAAQRQSQTMSEWVRQTLLAEARSLRDSTLSFAIFTDVLANQLILMNVLEPLLSGETLSPEQIKRLFREVQATKATRAQEVLTRRAQKLSNPPQQMGPQNRD